MLSYFQSHIDFLPDSEDILLKLPYTKLVLSIRRH